VGGTTWRRLAGAVHIWVLWDGETREIGTFCRQGKSSERSRMLLDKGWPGCWAIGKPKGSRAGVIGRQPPRLYVFREWARHRATKS
jgi:hypothetical protein